MCLQYILVRFTPSIILSSSLTVFLEQFQQISFFYFRVWIQNASTIFTLIPTFLVPTHLPMVPTLRKDLFFLHAFHFLKVYINSPRGFTLILHTYIYHTLIKLTHSATYSFSSIMLP
jgi:hypothetical protein